MMQPSTKRHLRDYAGPAFLVLAPATVVLLLLLVPRPRSQQFIKDNWGNAASVWGLVVGFYVLVVARGARRAARETRDREILRSLLDSLEEANSNIRELGLFARESKWDIVYIKSVDALTHCQAAISNWDDDPASRKMKNKLNTAATITRSIANITVNLTVRPLDEHQRDQVLRAQLDVGELLGAVMGYIEKTKRKVTQP
jgi:uncharacterized membrane protein YcjF (UPF0283 family)